MEKQFLTRLREMLPETALENDCRNQLMKQVTVNFPDPGGGLLEFRTVHRPGQGKEGIASAYYGRFSADPAGTYAR